MIAVASTKKETRLNIRIDPELKDAAQIVANDMGMDLSVAVTMFITKMVKDHALPFTPTSPVFQIDDEQLGQIACSIR